MRHVCSLAICALLTCVSANVWAETFGSGANTFEMDFVTVGFPGNPADSRYDLRSNPSEPMSDVGSVLKEYRIGKTEVTNRQFVAFLNSVAKDDHLGLFEPWTAESTVGGIARSGESGSYTYTVKPTAIGKGPNGSDYAYADKPVIGVTWYSAIRFVNWLHNGQGDGGTEHGAYELLGGTRVPGNFASITRNPDARWWIPSEDEWHKAAYYNPIAEMYVDFATRSNEMPSNRLAEGDSGNSANYYNGTTPRTELNYPLMDAGAYALSSSFFGTHDQSGSVGEWTERRPLNDGTFRRVRGGSWNYIGTFMNAGVGIDALTSIGHEGFGFRVAGNLIPEPSAAVLFAYGTFFTLYARRRQF